MKIALTSVGTLSAILMANIDCICLIDRSGSMSQPSTRFPSKTKWEELQEDVGAVAREAMKYDSDGITVISFGGNVSINDDVTADAVEKLFAENGPRGGTPLAEALVQAAKKVEESKKNCAVLVWTDGSPDDVTATIKQIESMGKFGRPKIGITFIQVGNDKGAADFLSKIDNEMTVDICATVSAKEAESLSVPQLFWLGQNE